MEEIVTGFVGALRERGVRVSPGECLDAVQALALGGLEGREGVRALLQLTLVKREADLPVFAELFESYFSGGGHNALELTASELLSALIHIVEGEELKVDPGRPAGEEGAPLLLDQEPSPDDLEEPLAIEESDAPPEGAEVQVQIEGYRGKLEAPTPSELYLPSAPTMAFQQQVGGARAVPFTPEETSEMQEVVCRMLVRIRKDVKRMREEESRGTLHVARTIRKNYRHGMVPFLLSLRRKRKEKPRLVVLCDVSFSVSHATRFLLLLLHTIQSRLMEVRSFVFNREVVEITEKLRNLPVNTLLETIDGGEIVNLDDNSDYGHVFLAFKQRHLEGMRGKPAVIILGDGRNNYQEPNDWALEELREKAGYLLWLTPEGRDTWQRGDCLMELYGSYCDRVEVVKSAEELSLLVEELFLTLYDQHDTRAWQGRARGQRVAEPLDYRDYYTRGSSTAAV